jgi:hypothetical protein
VSVLLVGTVVRDHPFLHASKISQRHTADQPVHMPAPQRRLDNDLRLDDGVLLHRLQRLTVKVHEHGANPFDIFRLASDTIGFVDANEDTRATVVQIFQLVSILMQRAVECARQVRVVAFCIVVKGAEIKTGCRMVEQLQEPRGFGKIACDSFCRWCMFATWHWEMS